MMLLLTVNRHAVDRFGVNLLFPPKVVLLQKRKWIEETTYPRFTVIGQRVGSIYLTWEALNKFVPLYYMNRSGYAFTYPLARLFRLFCYHGSNFIITQYLVGCMDLMVNSSWTHSHIEKLWGIPDRIK